MKTARHYSPLPAIVVLAFAFCLVLGTSLPTAAQAETKKVVQVAKTPQKAAKTNISKKSSNQGAKARKKSAKNSGSGKKGSGKKAGQNVAKAEPPLPWPQNVEALIGTGAILVMDPHAPKSSPQELYAYNADKFYTPASILKIVTSGAALEALGPDYRFKTVFSLDKDNNLWVTGHGDPYLVPEELAKLAAALRQQGLTKFHNLCLDSSYFEQGLVLDGNSQTRNPYDAFNGALGANFNTIVCRVDKKGRVSPSGDIPLTPLALEVAGKLRRRGEVCLNISESPAVAELHAGQLIQAYLEQAGVEMSGRIVAGQARPAKTREVLTHESSLTLEDMVRLLLKHSNNYMTNQIFLAMGAEIYGAPANLTKSLRVMEDYFYKHSLANFTIGDGSGLSRQSSLTARHMAAVLSVFEPDRFLLSNRKHALVFAKTGTMSDIHTLAGYIERPEFPDRPLSFVILMNGTGYRVGAREKILEMLMARFTGPESDFAPMTRSAKANSAVAVDYTSSPSYEAPSAYEVSSGYIPPGDYDDSVDYGLPAAW